VGTHHRRGRQGPDLGAVPEGQEAKPGRYGVFEVQADGSLTAEPVKTFETSKTRAVDWQLSHRLRLGGNPELAVRWVEDKPADPEPQPEPYTIGGQPACGACQDLWMGAAPTQR